MRKPFPLLMILMLLAGSAFASEEAPPPPPPPPVPPPAAPMPQPPPFGPMTGETPSRFSLALGPAWAHVLRDNYASAFTANGFNNPGRDRVALDLLGYWTTESAWQLGLDLTSLSFEQNSGSSSADFSNDVLGLWLGHELYRTPAYDVTVGSLIGLNEADETVLSTNKNGRLRESSAVMAPSVGVASRVSRLVKLGARFSYLIPFGESTQASGQDLGVSKIGVRGFLLSLLVILGR